MKIIHTSDELGRLVLQATPGTYDATPTAPDLILDVHLEEIPAPRLALAEAFVCLGSVSGELVLDAELHPATAELLPRVTPHRWIHASPVRFAPADIPGGSLNVKVLDGGCTPFLEWADDATEDLWLTLLPADRYAGHMASLRSRWIPTNMDLVGNSPAPLWDTWHRRLATLLLLSHELDVRRFVIPQEWTAEIRHLDAYVQLFRTVGISLTVTIPEGSE